MTLANEVAFITGATRGIGRAIALELGKRGARVVGLVPAAVRRTFTLLELARIASSAPPPPEPGSDPGAPRLRDAVAGAAQMRRSK